MIANATREIPARDIYLFEKIWDHYPEAHKILYYLEFLALHMPAIRLRPSLEWLIRNELTGAKFIDFVSAECASSGLELIRQLTKRIEREKNVRKLFSDDVR